MSATVTIDGVSCSYLEALRANADDADVVGFLRDLFHRASLASLASGTMDLGAGGLSEICVQIEEVAL